MLSIIKSIALQGLEGYLVSAQVDVSSGLPNFEIVGLPDTAVRESKERVKTAIKNSNVEFLSRKIIVNLAPANIKKEGSMYDLPIAVGILISTGAIYNKPNDTKNLNQFLEETIFLGELSLNGNIEKIKGVLPICIEAKKLGIKRIILPKSNCKEATVINDIEIIAVKNLEEIINFLNGDIKLQKQPTSNYHSQINSKYEFDFSEVKGQENVKRALEVAAAGGHNCILIRKSWLR